MGSSSTLERKATLCFATLFVPFIKLWIGENYVLPSTTILLICFNFYIYGIRAPIDTAKEAAGVYREDKYAPLIWSALNIILSIAFVKLFGLIGVVLGTTVSSLLVPCWNRPYIVYKYVFHSSSIKYFKDAIKKLLILIIMYIAIYFIISHFIFDNLVIVIIYRLLVCFVVFSIFILLFFRKSDEFKFYVEFIKTKILHK